MTHPTGNKAESESELVAARERPSRRRLHIEAVIAALIVLCVYVARRPNPVRSLGTMYDDVVYVSLAKAIATGQGNHSIHLVGAPGSREVPARRAAGLCARVGHHRRHTEAPKRG